MGSEVKENATVKNSTPLDTNAKTVQKEADEVKTVQENTDVASKTRSNSIMIELMFLATLVAVLGCLVFFLGHLGYGRSTVAGCSSVVTLVGVIILAWRMRKSQSVEAKKKE